MADAADFGLAKPDMSRSNRETTCGTPLYMSPEAVLNMQNASEGGHAVRPKHFWRSCSCWFLSNHSAGLPLNRAQVGFEADWWALGAVSYEMLVGAPPFSARQFAGCAGAIKTAAVTYCISFVASSFPLPACRSYQ